jgi:hypothetical protein
MANRKISELTELSEEPSSDDVLILNDISDATGSAQGTTKKISVSNLLSAHTITDEDLRGTDNPHIGAYPNQSLRVIDNSSKSVLVTTSPDGSLTFNVKEDTAKIYLNTPSEKLTVTFGLAVNEDSGEPDIEIESNGKKYSVISGDSDTKGANGLPIRQGFQNPDIGANPAPILISGGSIA